MRTWFGVSPASRAPFERRSHIVSGRSTARTANRAGRGSGVDEERRAPTSCRHAEAAAEGRPQLSRGEAPREPSIAGPSEAMGGVGRFARRGGPVAPQEPVEQFHRSRAVGDAVSEGRARTCASHLGAAYGRDECPGCGAPRCGLRVEDGLGAFENKPAPAAMTRATGPSRREAHAQLGDARPLAR